MLFLHNKMFGTKKFENIIQKQVFFINNNQFLILHASSKKIFLSRMASKPINIRLIRTGSQPYQKIMYSIELQIIF